MIYLLSFFVFIQADAQEMHLSVEDDPQSNSYGQVKVGEFQPEQLKILEEKNLDFQQWASFFHVKVTGSKRAVLGSYSIDESMLVFTPRFLPDPQVTYEVRFLADTLGKYLKRFSGNDINITLRFRHLVNLVENRIEMIPRMDTLPSNILRIYLQFSSPMSLENPHQFISIKDEDGNTLKEPFVEIEEGLWNSDRTRLTLLFHPGRIKRGVGPNVTDGKIFLEGKTYKLVVSEEWKTGDGTPLGKTFEKSIFVGGPVRKKIETDQWIVSAPEAGTTNSLKVITTENLDKALSERLISVYSEKDNLVEGILKYDSPSRSLTFIPQEEWSNGSYLIVVSPKLEDICGNTIYNVFDLEGEGMSRSQKNEKIPFRVR